MKMLFTALLMLCSACAPTARRAPVIPAPRQAPSITEPGTELAMRFTVVKRQEGIVPLAPKQFELPAPLRRILIRRVINEPVKSSGCKNSSTIAAELKTRMIANGAQESSSAKAADFRVQVTSCAPEYRMTVSSSKLNIYIIERTGESVDEVLKRVIEEMIKQFNFSSSAPRVSNDPLFIATKNLPNTG